MKCARNSLLRFFASIGAYQLAGIRHCQLPVGEHDLSQHCSDKSISIECTKPPSYKQEVLFNQFPGASQFCVISRPWHRRLLMPEPKQHCTTRTQINVSKCKTLIIYIEASAVDTDQGCQQQPPTQGPCHSLVLPREAGSRQ